MSDLLDIQVQVYPEILRRMAAGEKLSAASDENEKLAAAMLVAEALENEKKAEAAPAQEKKAIDIGLGTLALLGLATPTVAGGVKKLITQARGEPVIPEAAGEILKSFRKIIEEREKADVAKRMAIAAGLGGVAAGAIAAKALSKDDKGEKKSSESNRIEGAKLAEGEGTEAKEPEAQEQSSPAPGSVNARALLDKVLKNLQ